MKEMFWNFECPSCITNFKWNLFLFTWDTQRPLAKCIEHICTVPAFSGRPSLKLVLVEPFSQKRTTDREKSQVKAGQVWCTPDSNYNNVSPAKNSSKDDEDLLCLWRNLSSFFQFESQSWDPSVKARHFVCRPLVPELKSVRIYSCRRESLVTYSGIF